MRKANNAGFTLLELIITIAIIAILAGVIVPQLIKYIEHSKEISDVQIATHIIDAATLAVIDQSNNIPPGYYVEVLWITGNESGAYAGIGQIMVRPGGTARVSVYNDNAGTDDIAPIPRDTDLSGYAADVMNTLGATDMRIQYTVEYVADFQDAQSEMANGGNLAFHIDTSTGEVALAQLYGETDAANKWIELGIPAIPAP